MYGDDSKLEFSKYPKSLKKVLRWIRQDATIEKLEEIQILLENAINSQKNKLLEKNRKLF